MTWSKNSEFFWYPINLYSEKTKEEEIEEEINDEEDKAKTKDEEKVTEAEIESKKKEKTKVTTVEHQWELVNKNKAPWTHPQSETTNDEYGEFYKSLTNDYEKHLSVKHFRTEGDVVFKVLLFASNVLFNLFGPKRNLTNQTLCSTCFCHEQL
jgi:molecular chaperone HtpG